MVMTRQEKVAKAEEIRGLFDRSTSMVLVDFGGVTVETITDLRSSPKVLIIRMRNVPAVDSTGLNALRDVVSRFRRVGARVILSDVHAQPMVALQRSAFWASQATQAFPPFPQAVAAGV